MQNGKDTNQERYYVAALDIGATECRLAVQLLDADRKPIDPIRVYAQRQIEMGEGYVSNIEVTSRVVAQVAGHMSKILRFDVKKMAVIYMVGDSTTVLHPHNVRCTEQRPETTSRIVMDVQIDIMHCQAEKWKENEEANGDWKVVYNRPVEYYTKDRGVKRIRGNPVGTFTDQIYSDYLSVKVRKEYVDRFCAALSQAGISATNFYVEGLATPCVQKDPSLRKGRDLYMHLGHTKSVLSEVFAGKNGELQLSHYAWLLGIGNEFSAEYAKIEHDCTQEAAYERLQQDVQFDQVNLDAADFEGMVHKGNFKNARAAQITGIALLAVWNLVSALVKVLNEWYTKEDHRQIRFYIHLSGGIAGLKGIDRLMLRYFQIMDEARVERIDLIDLSVSYDVVSSQSEGQVREETLCSVLGALRQEIVRKEEHAIDCTDDEKLGAHAAGASPSGEPLQGDAAPLGDPQAEQKPNGENGFLSRVKSFVKEILQGPSV